jgi:hypothetical protein
MAGQQEEYFWHPLKYRQGLRKHLKLGLSVQLLVQWPGVRGNEPCRSHLDFGGKFFHIASPHAKQAE